MTLLIGICAVGKLLESCPDLRLVLTVRATLSTDVNTSTLQELVSKYRERQLHIHELDLSNLARIGHIAHVALILRLVRHFDPAMAALSYCPIPPHIPEDLDVMVHPKPNADYAIQGFELYSNSKLLATTWGYALNNFLEKDADLSSITAVMIDPGTLSDSRAFATNTPSNIRNLQRFILRPLRFFMGNIRTSAAAAADVVDLATNKAHPDGRGYYTQLKKTESSPQSMDTDIRQRVWLQSDVWAGVDI
ncbi:NAD(P)-binding protein [Xylariaceae sp. FL1272]|nr:NAD(P)-binding protein [Xylariaceae sp. FL1272]